MEERNIPRDSFVNRVLFLLVAKKPALAYLGFHTETTADIEARPLTDVAGFLHDPFFHLRSANKEIYRGISFPDGPFGKGGPNLFAMNTAATEEDWEMFTTPFDDDALLLDMGIQINREAPHAAD